MLRNFPVVARLTSVALAYRNQDIALIADQVLPRTPTSYEFRWLKYDLAQGFTVPETRVGRKSLPNQVDFSATDQTDRCTDFGLDDIVPNEDIQVARDQGQGIDPEMIATQYLTNLIQLGREIRVAGLVFNSASYNAGNVSTLSGTSQWSDTANSDPVKAILSGLDQPIVRPNIGVFGQATYSALRSHPKVVQAIRGTAQGAGIVSRREIADLFELQDVYVGAGFVNNAKKGQTTSMSRVWGKHAAFIYRDRAAGPQAGVTFGFTAEFGTKFAGSLSDERLGLTGSTIVRVGERVKEIVCAPDVGLYFQNAVA
ncbi:MAG: major capsid protein [Proteobacteria bacterium]|nr:major capsid protein [Pseudomonadota bacterium]